MITIPAGVRIYLACGTTDMRKGFDGLSMVSEGCGLRRCFRFPLDGDWIRRRRCASPVATTSRATARPGG